MNKKDLWALFAKTGKIEYHLKYKDYESKKEVNHINDKTS